MELLIKQGRVLDPASGLDREPLDIFCRGGKIVRVGKGIKPGGKARVIDARGLVVCPGFIDGHCHLREPGREDEETIASGALSAVAGGFTTVLAMPNTTPCLDNGPLVSFVRRKGARQPATVLPIGAITMGRQGKALAELADLKEHGAVAFSDDGNCLADGRLMRRALEYALMLDRPVIDHCEEPCLARGGVMNEGLLATRLGLPGIPAQAEEVIVFRDISLSALTGAHLHLAHLSTAGSANLLREARRQKIPVTGEVTVHHLTLTEDLVAGYNTNAKVNPPLRTGKDVRALRRAFREGVIDIIVTDHAPHSREEKETDFESAAFGMTGLETALPLLLRLTPEIPLLRVVAGLTVNPARLFKLEDRGFLQAGHRADITIFDPVRKWLLTPDTIKSRSRNTPLLGQNLAGRVVYTVSGGQVVFENI